MKKLKMAGILCGSLLAVSSMTAALPADALTLYNFFDPISSTLADMNDSITLTPFEGCELASYEFISGENCITIDENFTIRPIEDGTAEIYVYSTDGKQGYSKITVDFSKEYSTVSVLGSDFRIYEDHAVLVKYTAPRTFAYNIPETAAGLPVTEIGDRAFMGSIWTPEIVIPDTVTRIGNNAFSTCTDLEKIQLPASLKEIGDGAFAGDKLLTEIVIPEGTEIIGRDAFRNCTALENITFPSTLKEIRRGYYNYGAFTGTAWQAIQPAGIIYAGTMAYFYKGDKESLTELTFREGTKGVAEYAFADCKNLQSITWPDTMKYINSNAFSNCRNLETNQLPANLETLGKDAFSSSHLIEQFVLDESNPNFSIVDGIVYDKNLTEIIAIPKGIRSADIPSSIKEIPEFAFNYCTNLTDITLPEGLASIGEHAFYGAGLTALEIPDTVTEIGKEAFNFCENLKSVKLSAGMPEIESETLNIMIEYDPVPDDADYQYPDDEYLECIIQYNGLFDGCQNITTLIFPKELITVGDGTFQDCHIKDTYYTGTPEEWEAVEKGDANSYGTVHFNVNPDSETTGDISLDGEFTVSDVVQMKKYLLGQAGMTKQGFANADLNQDGTVNIYDFLLMKKNLLN